MGTVPNAVFERVLAAVDANQSAEVLTVANQLLDAGNSPAQLARQCVRYLRNCLVAKVAGVSADGAGLDGPAAELLQISPDEQRRAARTAALFSEEELTRFLQTMLRTFDELGYRQEQRFHFELGLLKLVHLRRLLPVEEVLSKFAGGAAGGGKTAAADAGGARSSAGSASVGVRAGVAPMQARASAATASAFVPLPPSLRPAAASARRETVAEPVAVAPVVAAMLPVVDPAAVVAPAPFAAAVPVVAMESAWQASGNAGGVAVFEAEEDSVAEVVFDLPASAVDEVEDVAAMLTDDAIGSATASTAAPASAAAGAGGVDAAGLQRAAVEALSSAASQGSASDALADAEWTVLNGEVRIQTELSKTMLPVVVNAEAEKILRAAVVERAPGLRVTLLPGAAKVAAAKKPRVARAGSAQAKAMEHPVVREAQRLFQAEIRNVIDLSDHE
jgi:DNA polymerase-3 subunit gamma/tau